MSNGLQKGNEALELPFPKLYTFSKYFEPLSRNRDPNVTQNEHLYAICCRPEEVDDVIYCDDAETFQKYVCINLSVVGAISSFRSSPENRNQPFV